MVIWAWIGALLIGIMLGLLGSGGSILTVPVLVYLVGEPDKLAIAESLGIVTLISLFGAVPFALKRQVDWRSVLYFGLPGMAGAYLGAYLSSFLSGSVQLLLFAGVMLLAAVMMFRQERGQAETPPPHHAAWKIALEGVAVGVLTGLVGVGGGFLIVPALVLLGGLPMRLAVGTSLSIIALKSATGFYKYVGVLAEAGLTMNWDVILLVTAVGILGSFAGKAIGNRISQGTLRRGFAAFLVVMGAFIIWQNAGALARPALQAHTPNTDHPKGDTMMPFFNRRPSHEAAGAVRTMTPAEFAARRNEAVVLDVRTPAEYASGHVEGALNIDLQSRDFADRVRTLDPEQTYLLYCRSGNRSGRAAEIMASMGFRDVYNAGGVGELARAGSPIVRE